MWAIDLDWLQEGCNEILQREAQPHLPTDPVARTASLDKILTESYEEPGNKRRSTLSLRVLTARGGMSSNRAASAAVAIVSMGAHLPAFWRGQNNTRSEPATQLQTKSQSIPRTTSTRWSDLGLPLSVLLNTVLRQFHRRIHMSK